MLSFGSAPGARRKQRFAAAFLLVFLTFVVLEHDQILSTSRIFLPLGFNRNGTHSPDLGSFSFLLFLGLD